MRLATQTVRQSTITRIGVRACLAQARDELARLLDGAPVTRPLGAVPLDSLGHLGVARERGRDEGHAYARRLQLEGEAALAAACTAENEVVETTPRSSREDRNRKVRARAGLLALGSSYSPHLPGLAASGSRGFRPRLQ